MSEQNGRVKTITNINNFALLEGLVHVCNTLLLRLAVVDLDEDGQSPWLTLVLTDLDKQPLSKDAKELILAMISSVETTLRSLAHKEGDTSGS